MNRFSRVVAMAAAAGLMTGLVSCSGQDDQAPAPNPPAPAPSASAVISPPKLSTVPELSQAAGIVKDTTMADCAAAKGPVKASGKVKNSAKKAQDLVVVVSWIVPQGSDVVARGVAVIKDAKAGSEHDWAVAGDVKIDQQVQCVLSARRGALAKA